jgi:hypothetical protein
MYGYARYIGRSISREASSCYKCMLEDITSDNPRVMHPGGCWKCKAIS